MSLKTIILLLGASGSGKTTLGKHLRYNLGIPEFISHTTREIRIADNEIDGENYYFTNNEDFHKIEKIESVNYPKDSPYWYGLSKKEVEDKLSKNDVVFVITDLHGLVQLKKIYPDSVKVVYCDTSLEEMKTRMVLRGDSPDKIEGRLKNAIDSNELKNFKYADFIIPKGLSKEESSEKMTEIYMEITKKTRD